VNQKHPLCEWRVNVNVSHPVAPVSRRVAVARLGAGGLGAALAARLRAGTAQEGTPPVTTALPPAVEEFFAAFVAFDVDRIVTTLTEDALLEEVPAGIVRKGRDAFRAYLEGFFAAFSGAALRYTTAFATDAWAAAEWRFSGHYTGQLPDLPPGAGQLLTIRGADFLELADGQIRSGREYYDLYSLLTQVGVLPPPEAATPPA
jgi:steroid delta-isomerase-like uncharacterized protein